MYPKWLYIFNHWMWIVALGVLLLATAFCGICCLIDWIGGGEIFSYEFLCFLVKFYGWCAPASFALFAAGTEICIQYVDEKKEGEQK